MTDFLVVKYYNENGVNVIYIPENRIEYFHEIDDKITIKLPDRLIDSCEIIQKISMQEIINRSENPFVFKNKESNKTNSITLKQEKSKEFVVDKLGYYKTRSDLIVKVIYLDNEKINFHSRLVRWPNHNFEYWVNKNGLRCFPNKSHMDLVEYIGESL